MTIILSTPAEIEGMDQLVKFFLQCDIADDKRYRVATNIAREIKQYIEDNEKPSSG